MRNGLILFVFFHATNGFASYSNIVIELDKIVQREPALASKFDVGKNDQGVAIQGVQISGEPWASIHHLVVGTHHGNERGAPDLALRFVNRLLSVLKNPSHPLHAALVDKKISVVPVLNTSGYDINRREEKDSKGVWQDPNRDYDDPCDRKNDYLLSSTSRLARYVYDQDVVAAVSIHGYIGTFTYPWGYHTDNYKSLDHSVFDSLGRAAVSKNGYATGTHGDLIYPASGTFEDWAYYEHGVWSALIEMKHGPNFDHDADSLLEYLARAPVSRSSSHKPIGNCKLRRLADAMMSRP